MSTEVTVEPAGRVRLELDAAGTPGLARLTLVRVDARNGIDPDMVAALVRAVEVLDGQPDLRAVLIRNEGPAFTVGGDLKHFTAHLDDLPGQLDAMIDGYHRAVLAPLSELPVPVLAAPRGAVAGGGLGLLWVADEVISADDLRIATGFSHLALSGDGGSSWHLPRLVGLARARQLILGGRTLGAAEALDWGLVRQVVAAAELDDAGLARARELAAGPTFAYARMKRLLLGSTGNSYREQLLAERNAIVECGATEDARDGVRAFVERRPPAFRGR